MIKAMKKIFFNFILLGTLLLSTLISAQVVLTALEAPNGFTSTQTRSYTGTFTKNNCSEADYRGTSVTYTQSATATATSTISQADADRLAANAATAEAQKLVNQDGQAYANLTGRCVPQRYDGCEIRQGLYSNSLSSYKATASLPKTIQECKFFCEYALWSAKGVGQAYTCYLPYPYKISEGVTRKME